MFPTALEDRTIVNTIRLPSPSIETINLDDEREMDVFDQQIIGSGMECVRAHRAELRAKGPMSADGKLLVMGLPENMKPSAERDFVTADILDTATDLDTSGIISFDDYSPGSGFNNAGQ